MSITIEQVHAHAMRIVEVMDKSWKGGKFGVVVATMRQRPLFVHITLRDRSQNERCLAFLREQCPEIPESVYSVAPDDEWLVRRYPRAILFLWLLMLLIFLWSFVPSHTFM